MMKNEDIEFLTELTGSEEDLLNALVSESVNDERELLSGADDDDDEIIDFMVEATEENVTIDPSQDKVIIDTEYDEDKLFEDEFDKSEDEEEELDDDSNDEDDDDDEFEDEEDDSDDESDDEEDDDDEEEDYYE